MNTETITAAIQIAKALETESGPHPLPDNGDLLPAALVGSDVLIRTVTMIYTGSVIGVDAHTIALDNAAWIADTGRFGTALTRGELAEVEPYPDTVYVARSCVVDITFWNHALPRNAK
jgi:hypothetical protein